MNKLDYVIVIIVFILLFVISFLESYTLTKNKHFEEIDQMLSSSEYVLLNKYVTKSWYGKYKYYIVLEQDERPRTYEVKFQTYVRLKGD